MINSWGQDWGDGGFFWLPYAIYRNRHFSAHAYILIDGRERGRRKGPPPPTPPPCGQGEPRPNLRPGKLECKLRSAARGKRHTGVRSPQHRSGDRTGRGGCEPDSSRPISRADTSDAWLMFEEIPFKLQPGVSAVRDEDNPVEFRFPRNDLRRSVLHGALGG